MSRTKLIHSVLWINLVALAAAWVTTLKDPHHYNPVYTGLVFYVFAFATIVLTFCMAHHKSKDMRNLYNLSILSDILTAGYVILRITELG